MRRTLGTLAAAYAQAGKFEDAVGWQAKAAKLYTPDQKAKWGFLLDLYKGGKPFQEQDNNPKRSRATSPRDFATLEKPRTYDRPGRPVVGACGLR